MCIDPNRPQFNAVIESVVDDFLIAKQPFSAYDVTKAVRIMTGNDPDLIKDQGQAECWVNGHQVAQVLHEDVKNVVHDLFHQNRMPNYDRIHDGKHWVYIEAPPDPSLAAGAPVDPVTSITPIGAGVDGGSYDGTPTL